MSIPTNQGYAIISAEASGMLTVSISVSRPDQGGSDEIYAEHTGERKVAVDPSIPLATSGNVSWTTVPVQVFVDSEGTVNIASVTRTGLMSRPRVHGGQAGSG
jgi:hypothetical protein